MYPIKCASLAERAQFMAQVLVDHVDPEKGNCDPRKWDTLFFEGVCQQGQYVREAGPLATLVYQKYVEIAALFLERYPDLARAQNLKIRIEHDMAHYRTKFELIRRNPLPFGDGSVKPFTPQEYALMVAAAKKIEDTMRSIKA